MKETERKRHEETEAVKKLKKYYRKLLKIDET